jgi:hypothetical protein
VATPDVAPEVRDLSRSLLPEADALGARMAERISAEIPLYSEAQVISLEQLTASCTENLRYVLGQLAGVPSVSLDSPRATGMARAQEGVPYAAVLQAFRVGGRYIWELLVEHAEPGARDVLLLAAADIWTVTDELSSQVTDAYRTALGERVRRDQQMRAVLVGTLLDGDPGVVEELWEKAGALNLPRGGDFVVVSAECSEPGAEGLPDIEQLLRRHNVTSAWRLDHDQQDGLVALRFGFAVHHLVEVLAEATTGRVGVSAPFQRLDDAPDARREARIACAAATPQSYDVLRFDEHPLAALLASTPDQAAALARAVLAPVLDLPPDDRAVLLQTADTWLAAEGSTSTAARQLHLHRNTVRYRLRRLEELTGRDLAKPVDAAEVYVALECVRILALG